MLRVAPLNSFFCNEPGRAKLSKLTLYLYHYYYCASLINCFTSLGNPVLADSCIGVILGWAA